MTQATNQSVWRTGFKTKSPWESAETGGTLTFDAIRNAPKPVDLMAHAEVVAGPARDGQPIPDGVVRLGWLDRDGVGHEVDVVKWWKFERTDLSPGTQMRVEVNARQYRDNAYPPFNLSATLVVTEDPADTAEVVVGDEHRSGMWWFGVHFVGATVIEMH